MGWGVFKPIKKAVKKAVDVVEDVYDSGENLINGTTDWLGKGGKQIGQLGEDITDKLSGKRTDKRAATNRANDEVKRQEAKNSLIQKKNDKQKLASKVLSGGQNLMSGGRNLMGGGSNNLSGGQNLTSGGSNMLSSSGKNFIQ
jgi:hypothetical protein